MHSQITLENLFLTLDRKRNRRNPQMKYTYKEMYLLEDGYSGFFDQYKVLI